MTGIDVSNVCISPELLEKLIVKFRLQVERRVLLICFNRIQIGWSSVKSGQCWADQVVLNSCSGIVASVAIFGILYEQLDWEANEQAVGNQALGPSSSTSSGPNRKLAPMVQSRIKDLEQMPKLDKPPTRLQIPFPFLECVWTLQFVMVSYVAIFLFNISCFYLLMYVASLCFILPFLWFLMITIACLLLLYVNYGVFSCSFSFRALPFLRSVSILLLFHCF
jgi:hypothetical protein